jgi:hypothetical protein
MLIRRRESLAKCGYRPAHIFAYVCIDMADHLLMSICGLMFLILLVPPALFVFIILFPMYMRMLRMRRRMPVLPTGCTVFSVIRGLYLVFSQYWVDVYADYFIEKHAELISYKHGRFRTEVLSYYFCALWLFRECFDLIFTLIMFPIKSVWSWVVRDL